MELEHVESIRKELSLRETEDLLEIWQLHKQEEWTEEAFEAVRLILQDRLGYVPEYEQRDEADRHLYQAQIFVDEGEFEKALEETNQAIGRALHYAEAFSAKGAILDQLGRLEDAVLAYQKAIDLDPHLAPAREALRFVEEELIQCSSVIDMQPFRLKRLYTESWALLFQSRSIWIFGILIAVSWAITYLPNYWPPLACISTPIYFVINFFSSAGVLLLLNNVLFKQPTLWGEIWKLCLRNILPLGILSFIGVSAIFVLGFVLVIFQAIPAFRFPSVASIVLSILIFAVSMFATWVIIFSSVERVIYRTAILVSLKKGIKMIVRYPGKASLVTLAVVGTNLVNVAILSGLVIFLNQIPLTRELFSLEILSMIRPHPLTTILGWGSSIILPLWQYSALLLIFHWIRRRKPAVNTFSQIRLSAGVKRPGRFLRPLDLKKAT